MIFRFMVAMLHYKLINFDLYWASRFLKPTCQVFKDFQNSLRFAKDRRLLGLERSEKQPFCFSCLIIQPLNISDKNSC